MTVCAALKVVNENGSTFTIIGTDSEITVGSERLLGVIGDNKLFQLGEAVIAIAGAAVLGEVLYTMQSDEEYIPNFKTKDGVREFVAYFFDLLKELAEISISPSDILNSVDPLLIATPEHIWAVFTDLSIMEFEESYCIGSGWATAQAVIYDRMKDLKDLGDFIRFEDLEFILQRALEVASVFTQGCGGKIITTRVIEEEKASRPKPKKKGKRLKKEENTWEV